MSQYSERAQVLRDDPKVHFNCAQGVFIPFAEAKGISKEVANSIAANFGAGMKCGSVCGAVTGGLMALGLYGVEDPAVIGKYLRMIKDNHDGMLDCKDLLRVMAEKGEQRKAHCDGMVQEAVAAVEAILAEQNK